MQPVSKMINNMFFLSSKSSCIWTLSFFGGIGALRERLRTHKVFQKDQCFYLNYHKFSIKSYVLDVY